MFYLLVKIGACKAFFFFFVFIFKKRPRGVCLIIFTNNKNFYIAILAPPSGAFGTTTIHKLQKVPTLC